VLAIVVFGWKKASKNRRKPTLASLLVLAATRTDNNRVPPAWVSTWEGGAVPDSNASSYPWYYGYARQAGEGNGGGGTCQNCDRLDSQTMGKNPAPSLSPQSQRSAQHKQ
jgi:hypothetical protein